MRWEELTSPEFARAVRETGVCVLAMGVLERHSEHLPLGTDFLNGHKIACFAADKEPAVVFPPFYFGQIYEARCFPGAFTIRPGLLVELLLGVFDEIGRNGFRKIVIYNAHGGNNYLIPFLQQVQLWEEKSYSIYYQSESLTPERAQVWRETLETSNHGHACECETSVLWANFPHLAWPERIAPEPAAPLRRLEALPRAYTAVNWYSNYPEHYAGDARSASIAKGVVLRDLLVDSLAEFVAAVKADQVAPALQSEFFKREKDLRSW